MYWNIYEVSVYRDISDVSEHVFDENFISVKSRCNLSCYWFFICAWLTLSTPFLLLLVSWTWFIYYFIVILCFFVARVYICWRFVLIAFPYTQTQCVVLNCNVLFGVCCFVSIFCCFFWNRRETRLCHQTHRLQILNINRLGFFIIFEFRFFY